MRSSGNDRLKMIVGFLLLCICSCARFGDAAKANPQGLEFQQANVLWLRAMRCRIQSCQVGCQVMSYLCQRHRQWQGLCHRQAAQWLPIYTSRNHLVRAPPPQKKWSQLPCFRSVQNLLSSILTGSYGFPSFFGTVVIPNILLSTNSSTRSPRAQSIASYSHQQYPLNHSASIIYQLFHVKSMFYIYIYTVYVVCHMLYI